MQRVHLVCLILTGVCVVLLIIGTGIGIAHGKGDSEDDNAPEYEAYDEDYVEANVSSLQTAAHNTQLITSVIDSKTGNQGSGV